MAYLQPGRPVASPLKRTLLWPMEETRNTIPTLGTAGLSVLVNRCFLQLFVYDGMVYEKNNGHWPHDH
jgi:hypothetical protein